MAKNQHPAWALSFDELLQGLRAQVTDGYVKENPGPGGVALFSYTKGCTYKAAWNPFTVLARGLVLDLVNQRIIATPFPKFFNYGEKGATLPNLPFEAFEKMDGSLGILFHHGDTWYIVTRGAFDSEPAVWAQNWIKENIDHSRLEPGTTYLVEIIFSRNKMVVTYDFEGCVLLGAYDASGYEIESSELHTIAEMLGLRIATRHSYDALDRVIEVAKSLRGTDHEGFVLRFADGSRIKIKGDDYRRMHRTASNLTPLGIWDHIAAGKDLDDVRKTIEEEFWADFDAIRNLLEGLLNRILRDLEDHHLVWAHRPDVELGRNLDSIPEHVRPFIFDRRKRGAAWREATKPRAKLLGAIRPNANVLEGYTPSTLVQRCQQDAEESLIVKNPPKSGGVFIELFS